MSKVCIVGASGKLGQCMIQHALDRGDEVVGVCRQKSVPKLERFKGRITVMAGQTNDSDLIRRAVAGCDGVLTVLVPWGMRQYASGTARAVLDHAPADARLVFSCGWHITRDGQDVYSWKLKAIVSVFGGLARLARVAELNDQVEACRWIFASARPWTVVRGSDLEEGESQGLPVWSGHAGDPVLKSNLVRRVDFALFMVEALTNPVLIHEAPAIVGCQAPSALAHAQGRNLSRQSVRSAPSPASEDVMKDKVCIVTGGTSGIGKATVEGLASRGATVVIACRDVAKGGKVVAEVAAKTESRDLYVMQLDLASLASVHEFANAFAAKFSRLDVLVENAGVMTKGRQLTTDGLEMDFGVNHVGHFLLTDLLLPLLKASAPSRIVVVSSGIHSGARIDFEDLQGEKRWDGAYPRSKLANLLFVRALAKRLEGWHVVANALHPGVVSTELARDYGVVFRVIARWFFRSPAQGARTSLYLTTSPAAGEISGKYFVDSKPAKPSAAALDDALAERLWIETERLVARGGTPATTAKTATASSP